MAVKSDESESRLPGVSPERAARLFRLVNLLSNGSMQRTHLMKRLKVGIRTCYRDIDFLRECGVNIQTVAGGYRMALSLHDALSRIPFPDPELTFGDAMVLMRGRSASHKRLQRMVASMAD